MKPLTFEIGEIAVFVKPGNPQHLAEVTVTSRHGEHHCDACSAPHTGYLVELAAFPDAYMIAREGELRKLDPPTKPASWQLVALTTGYVPPDVSIVAKARRK